MIFDELTIISSIVLIVLAAITPLLNPFFRKTKDIPQEKETEDDEKKTDEKNILPPVSIILTPQDNAQELQKNLDSYLSQSYDAGFEVIVVMWKGDMETEDVLKRYADNPHLYYTYIPASSRYMSRKKLAITIGVKAAKNEWMLISDIECRPDSDKWLETLAHAATDNHNLVIGYTHYDDDTNYYRRFERLHIDLYLIRETQRGMAYRCNANALMFRKTEFLKEEGFRGNLKYLRGEYDFMVNKYASKDSTAIVTDEKGWLTEQEPTDKAWRNKHLFYMENRQHLQRSTPHRLLFNIDQAALHINYLVIMATAIIAVLIQNWIVTGAAALALIITMTMRTLIGKKTLSLFNEDIPAWRIVPYEIAIIWHNLGYKIKYRRADKYDFISHKL